MTIFSIVAMLVMVILLRFIPNKMGRKITFDFGIIVIAAVWAIHFVAQIQLTAPLLKVLGCITIAVVGIALVIHDFFKK